MLKPCENCRLVHAARTSCVDAHKANTLLLLTEIGVPGRCRVCASAIFWVRHRSGTVVQYTPYGQDHAVDCPDRVTDLVTAP
jgi:hypothetical protein